ncbi:MAG: hypothetical protein M3010_04780, partial [Candidatus Dormibacteraeota bacterium]|nr:hypothetical protein [Candidatus Dormibacteraeota bacterium]
MQLRRFLPFVVLLLGLTGTRVAAQQPSERYFAETGQWVRGRFLAYWDRHGGLAQQGYPLAGEFSEISTTDGKPYTVQYFERAVFEYHPEHAGTPYEILLSLVGVDAYREKYPQGAPNQRAHSEGQLFPATGKRLGGSFRTYWEAHGGLPQQGYPISDEFAEVSALDGKTYTVQYFERAVFEYHPEYKGTPYEVLLSQLGTYRHQARYKGSATPRPSPSSPFSPGSPSPGLPYPSPTISPAPTATPATPRPSLAIPTPRPGYTQSGMRGSDQYLIWQEYQPNVAGGRDIVGLDLASGQRINIATAAGNQQALALDGNQVLWQQDYPQNPCQTYPFSGANLYRKTLPGGAPTLIARGDNFPTAAAMHGDAVAWVTNGCDFDAHVRLWDGRTVQALRDS